MEPQINSYLIVGIKTLFSVIIFSILMAVLYDLYWLYWELKSKIYWDKDGLHCGYCGTSVQIIDSTPTGIDAVIEVFGWKHRRCAKKYWKQKG